MEFDYIEMAVAEMALQHHIIDIGIAADLIKASRRPGSRPLIEAFREYVAETELLRAVASEIGVEYVDLNSRDTTLSTDDAQLSRCEMDFLEHHGALPMVTNDGETVFVLSNTLDIDATSYLRSRVGQGRPVLAATSQIQARLLSITSGLRTDITPGPNAIPAWVDALLSYALSERASDIHFRYTVEGHLFVRIRVDGVLWRVPVPDAVTGRETEVIASVLARSSTIDTTNLREPQDGTFSFTAGGRKVEVRIGLIPQVTGPNVTLRILDSETIKRRPEEMGLRPAHISKLRSIMKEPQGCVIVVGPTGSGKTTTLHSLLREVDATSKNVVTVEDPVEYRLPYVGQTQIRTDLGDRSLTWAKALRSILRNDPDIVLVGEIRDEEVARVAMEAATTGHLVLTTLHAQTAPGAFSRLTQVGVPPYLVSEAVSAVVSQRLVRKVHDCAAIEPPTHEEVAALASMGLNAPSRVAHQVGCQGCAGTGYRGRMAVAELLIPTPAFRDTIATGQQAGIVRECARRAGWEPLHIDALRVITDLATTVTEVERVVGSAARDSALEDQNSGQTGFQLPPVFGRRS